MLLLQNCQTDLDLQTEFKKLTGEVGAGGEEYGEIEEYGEMG